MRKVEEVGFLLGKPKQWNNGGNGWEGEDKVNERVEGGHGVGHALLEDAQHPGPVAVVLKGVGQLSKIPRPLAHCVPS